LRKAWRRGGARQWRSGSVGIGRALAARAVLLAVAVAFGR
jgi:hypothetical protein